jgi:hypothetical protein
MTKAITLLTLLGSLCAADARAVDGVIEINQSKALAGGVTPGDAPGFPVQITAPGSYRLSSNLDLSGESVDTDAIAVLASPATIDLNGFELAGPSTCTGSGSGLVCSARGSGNGVSGPADDVAVHGGVIRNFAGAGISLSGRGARIHDVAAVHNVGDGMAVGNGASLHRCIARENGDDGIQTGAGAVASESVAQGNFGAGMELDGGGAVVLHATAFGNGADGIGAFNGGSVIAESAAFDNGNHQLNAAAGSSLRGNSLRRSAPGPLAAPALLRADAATIVGNALRGSAFTIGMDLADEVTASTVTGNNVVSGNYDGGLNLIPAIRAQNASIAHNSFEGGAAVLVPLLLKPLDCNLSVLRDSAGGALGESTLCPP